MATTDSLGVYGKILDTIDELSRIIAAAQGALHPLYLPPDAMLALMAAREELRCAHRKIGLYLRPVSLTYRLGDGTEVILTPEGIYCLEDPSGEVCQPIPADRDEYP